MNLKNLDRRQFLQYTAAAAAAGMVGCSKNYNKINNKASNIYVKADTDWFVNCTYGISAHLTFNTAPRTGPLVPHRKAVEQFKLENFVDAVVDSGADYVLFSCAHSNQIISGPNPVVDDILPGRTCQRDLIKELAVQLKKHNIHLILYYNHSCNQVEDMQWQRAVGYRDINKKRLADNLCEIIAWMGQHYNGLLKGWWFDSPYTLDPSGPHNTVDTDMTGFQFPWERYTAAAKTGNPSRLVTYNAGVNYTYLYTTHQDYWAGEMNDLNNPPTSRFQNNGLQWHGWTCLDVFWAHRQLDTEIPNVLYTDEKLISFVQQCQKHRAPMTLNVGMYQDGTISPYAIKQMQTLRKHVKKS